MNTKKIIRNVILVLAILILLVILLINIGDIKSIWRVVTDANGWYILLAIGILLLYAIMYQASLMILTKYSYKEIKVVDNYAISGSEFFFNSITPFSSGGQPFQAYALKRKKMSLSASTSNLLINFIAYQICLNAIAVTFLILYYGRVREEISSYIWFLIVGFVINIIVMVGLLLIGLSIFLTGVNVGFMPMGYLVGKTLSSYKLILVPIAMIIGYFIVTSEPAIGVLTLQIEEITNGKIKKKVLNVSLSIAISLATGLSILRILFGISIWWLLFPGYLFALIMSLFVPNIFTAIAFDSGGVASGTMTATFLLPFAVGVAESLNKNVLTDAFGLIALVATIPLITIQIVGLIYKIKTSHIVKYNDTKYNEEIINY